MSDPILDTTRVLMCKTVFVTIFHLSIMVVFLGLGVSPAIGQMTYGVNYSDTWIQEYNQPWTDDDGYVHSSDAGPPFVLVWGYGAVDGNAASYNHYYNPLTVTLTSPNGRTSVQSTSGSGYVRSDVNLQLVEPGDYYTTHNEQGYCPSCNCSHMMGSGGSGKRIGISYSAYHKAVQVDPYRAVSQLVAPCDVNCVFYSTGAVQRFSSTPFPNYFRIGEPWFTIAGYVVCEWAIASLEESNGPLLCYEG